MLSVSYAGKNAYSAGKTSGVLRVGASGANRCYVHPPPPQALFFIAFKHMHILHQSFLNLPKSLSYTEDLVSRIEAKS